MSEQRKEMSDGKKLVIVGSAIVAALAALIAFGPKERDRVKTPRGPSDFELQSACEKKIRSMLRAPRDAEFQSVVDHNAAVEDTSRTGPTKYYLDNVVAVAGYVDAQNAFGATIREPFVCVFTKSIPPTLQEVRFEGKVIK